MKLQQLQNQTQQLKQQLANEKSVENLQTKYLGKKGLFNTLAKEIRNIKKEEKKQAGKMLNEVKTHIEKEIQQKIQQHNKNKKTEVNLTLPGKKPNVGHMHPVSQAMERITHIFERIGFTRVRYPEVDWDWYAFESLNMPPDHPARDEWETFFVNSDEGKSKNISYEASKPRKRHPSLVGGKIVLTPHTSNGQVREMERLNSKPPIRMINIARCYRRQQDATHTQMFHQFEGLVVDKGISIQHLKGTLDYFAEEFYGPGTKSRIRPFHFQFTEPSFEVDFSCHICHGTGTISPSKESLPAGKQERITNEASQTREDKKQEEDKTPNTKCRFCKSGWHEVGGAGMVHPNVLKAGGIDPKKYTGFAFGWGIERTYTLQEGLNIDDIRLLYSNDLRFLKQF